MPLDTTLGNSILTLGNTIVWGTMMLDDEFGQVESSSVKRTADKKEIENGAGNLRSFLLTKARFELSFETIFDIGVTAPGFGKPILFPLVGVVGRVVDATIKSQKGKERMLSIEASEWCSLEEAPFYELDPEAQTWLQTNLLTDDALELNQGGNLILNQGGKILLNTPH